MPKRRIGAHCSTEGGAWTAIQRALDCGANTLQIFSSSPRTWKSGAVRPEAAAKLQDLRDEFDVTPLAIHASFLINLCAQTESIRQSSTESFRAEVHQALALNADFLVVHPGSWKGLTHAEGLRFATQSIERAVDGIAWEAFGRPSPLRILIENAPGAEFSLGSTLEQVAELAARLRPCAPVDVCLDTCHLHVAGYDFVSAEAYAATTALIESTVTAAAIRVWHCNDAKAPLGSKLDRHEHIGDGTMGTEPFRRLLHDERFADAAFLCETPAEDDSDNLRNVSTLRFLSAG